MTLGGKRNRFIATGSRSRSRPLFSRCRGLVSRTRDIARTGCILLSSPILYWILQDFLRYFCCFSTFSRLSYLPSRGICRSSLRIEYCRIDIRILQQVCQRKRRTRLACVSVFSIAGKFLSSRWKMMDSSSYESGNTDVAHDVFRSMYFFFLSFESRAINYKTACWFHVTATVILLYGRCVWSLPLRMMHNIAGNYLRSNYDLWTKRERFVTERMSDSLISVRIGRI